MKEALLIRFTAGLALILAGCIIRYPVLFNSHF
jgi:hypothetical protein